MSFFKLCVAALLFLSLFLVCGDETIGTTYSSRTDQSSAVTFSEYYTLSKNDLPSQDAVRKRVRPDSPEWKPGKTICPPRDSCKKRCGQEHRGLPFTCSCDSACVFYSDCCVDYELECGPHERVPGNVVNGRPRAPATCVNVSSYSLHSYVIAECSPTWHLGNPDVQQFLLSNEEICQGYHNGEVQPGIFDTVYLSACMKNITSSCQIGVIDQTGQQDLLIDRQVLVKDSRGYVYSSDSCAICNWQKSFVRASDLHLDSNSTSDQINDAAMNTRSWLRECFPSESTCSVPFHRIEDQIFESLCKQYGGPVLIPKPGRTGKSPVVYKNSYCAMCNGELLKTASCLVDREGSQRAVSSFFVHGILSINNKKTHNIPASFSLLLNFGLDGRQRVMMTSDDEDEIIAQQKLCGSTHIWDPFNKLCRRLYCSTDYILVDFKCVKRNSSGEDFENHEEDKTEWNSVHLTLSVQVVLLDMLHFYGRESNFSAVFSNSLAEEYNITADRIRNVKFKIALGNKTDLGEIKKNWDKIDENQPITLTIDFDLYEPFPSVNDTEPDVDSIVYKLSSSVSSSDDGIYLDLKKMKSRIFQVQHSASPSWCSPENGGVQKRYLNSDFVFITNSTDASPLDSDSVEAVYINKTGKTYSRGHFFASILYQRSESDDRSMNVSRMVVVCDKKTKLNESCMRVMLPKDDYSINPNGSLTLLKQSEASERVDTTVYELGENGSVFLCLKSLPQAYKKNKTVMYEFDITEAYVSLVLMCVSIFTLGIVLLTYTLFQSLRNLPGCNTMNLTFSLFAMQVTFLLGQRSDVSGGWCKASAILLHYEILCSFMWMNVMAYDLYKTFGNNSVLTIIRSKTKYLLRYIAYSYGCPVIIILIGILIDTFADGFSIAPHYGDGRNSCWITKQAAIYFFAGPLALVMLANAVLYAMTIVSIRSVKHQANNNNMSKRHHGLSDVMLYARMALVTGMTWILAFVAAYVPPTGTTGKIITYAFTIFNTMQGVFLFFVFVCNRRVTSLYTESIKKIWNSRAAGLTVDSILSRNAKAVNRSVSSDTTISTISNLSDTK